MGRRCPPSLLCREGQGRSAKKLLHLGLKNKGSLRLAIIGWVTRFYPSERVELPWLVSVPLTLAFHCVETSGKVCRKHNAQWLCHFKISMVCSPLPPTPTLKSPLDKRNWQVACLGRLAEDLCFTNSLEVNSSVLTESPGFHAFKINKRVFNGCICEDGPDCEDAILERMIHAKLTWDSLFTNRDLTDVGYWKYLTNT